MRAIRRYVAPGWGPTKRYMMLLGGNFLRLGPRKRARFLHSLARAAKRVTDEELNTLLDSEWRSRITAAWLIGFDRRVRFRDRLGELLLASELVYAGQGYCFALARFGEAGDADLLTAYLNRYLPRIDCRYDQQWAIGALLHIDEKLQTEHAVQFIETDLWRRSAMKKEDPMEWKCFMDELYAVARSVSSPRA